MTQHRLKRVTQSGRLTVEGSPTRMKRAPARYGKDVREKARVSVERGVR